MKKRTIFLILAAIVIAILLVLFILNEKNKNISGNIIKTSPSQSNKNQGNNITNNEVGSIEAIGGAAGSEGADGGGGGGASGGGGNSEQNPDESLPSDINQVECGFYYSEYGICKGICPEGVCVSEGRSCYCKRE